MYLAITRHVYLSLLHSSTVYKQKTKITVSTRADGVLIVIIQLSTIKREEGTGRERSVSPFSVRTRPDEGG